MGLVTHKQKYSKCIIEERWGEMGLWTLLEGFLLLANALAILNEDRFLTPRGWGLSDFSAGQTKSSHTTSRVLSSSSF